MEKLNRLIRRIQISGTPSVRTAGGKLSEIWRWDIFILAMWVQLPEGWNVKVEYFRGIQDRIIRGRFVIASQRGHKVSHGSCGQVSGSCIQMLGYRVNEIRHGALTPSFHYLCQNSWSTRFRIWIEFLLTEIAATVLLGHTQDSLAANAVRNLCFPNFSHVLRVQTAYEWSFLPGAILWKMLSAN